MLREADGHHSIAIAHHLSPTPRKPVIRLREPGKEIARQIRGPGQGDQHAEWYACKGDRHDPRVQQSYEEEQQRGLDPFAHRVRASPGESRACGLVPGNQWPPAGLLRGLGPFQHLLRRSDQIMEAGARRGLHIPHGARRKTRSEGKRRTKGKDWNSKRISKRILISLQRLQFFRKFFQIDLFLH